MTQNMLGEIVFRIREKDPWYIAKPHCWGHFNGVADDSCFYCPFNRDYACMNESKKRKKKSDNDHAEFYNPKIKRDE